MADERGTLHLIADHLVGVVRPLITATTDLAAFQALMREIGWDVGTLPPEYAAVGEKVAAAIMAAKALSNDAGVDSVLGLVDKVGDVHRAIRNLNTAPAGADAAAFLQEIGERLFELLITRYLAAHLPTVFSVFEATGVIDDEVIDPGGGRARYVRTRLKLDEIPKIITDPHSIPNRVYGWGSADLNFDRLASHLYRIFDALGLNVSVRRVDRDLSAGFAIAPFDETAKSIDNEVRISLFEAEVANRLLAIGLSIAELPAEGAHPAGMIVRPEVPDGISEKIAIDDVRSFELRAGTNLADLFGVVIRPDDIEVRYPFSPGNALPAAGFEATFRYAPPQRVVLLGKAGQTRLELGSGHVGLVIAYVKGELELRVDGELRDLAIVIAKTDVDGFLGSLFGGQDLVIPVQLGIAWSNRSGLNFVGGLGFQVSVYPHRRIGPISIDRFDLAVAAALGSSGPPSLDVSGALAFSGALGPIGFSTEGIGAQLRFLFHDGNAGPFDVRFGFKPPTALGLVIDAGPVTGGGFLSYEPEKHRYVGILQLSIYEISITAIGLLDTRTESGEALPAPGFSFLIIVSATGFAPIQLGWGFTLNGVGGLAGIHRTIVTEALQTGLRSGTLDHVLFPDDPVRNAPQIISDLRTVFPVAIGRFVFGPMARLGWGTPTLIHAELGVLLELPDPFRIIIIGQASALLPEDAPIVQIRIDVLGIIDFELQTFSIDASIRDSYVAGFALSGDMAMRLKWGGIPNFALSVGGLNPSFTPPPAFPTLRRITVSLGAGDNPRISIQGYLAITSNSIQFGALAELYASAAGFNVYGFVGFDALIIYQPFSFRIDYSAGFALRRGSRRIAGITVKGTLTGPSPFHIKGRGCISFLFFDVCVPFEATFGERRQIELPEKSPLAELEAAIADRRNWAPVLPSSVFAGVSFKTASDAAGLLLQHPMGRVSFRQKVIPLNKALERFGEFAITGPKRFDLTGVQIGDELTPKFDLVQDFMAPALSEDLTDREKVTRDAFELEVVGVEVGSTRPEFGPARTKVIVYEQRIVETPWRARVLNTLYQLPLAYQLVMSTLGAKAVSLLSRAGRRKFAPNPAHRGGVRLDDEKWTIVDASTLTAVPGLSVSGSKAEAMRAYKTHISRHPRDRARLEVVSRFETEVTA